VHPAPLFRETDPIRLAGLAAEHGLALIVAAKDDRPAVAHAPIVLADGRVRFHLSASNPICAVLAAAKTALVVVTGPDGYVSPDWYAAADQVPTWNYLSAEMEGPVRALTSDQTAALLDDLSARFEAGLAPKPPWTRAKMDPAKFAAMLKAIVGFEMTLARFEGVTKLSQNKSPDEIERVALRLAARTDEGSRKIAARMLSLP